MEYDKNNLPIDTQKSQMYIDAKRNFTGICPECRKLAFQCQCQRPAVLPEDDDSGFIWDAYDNLQNADSSLSVIIDALNHADWFIRTEAAAAIGEAVYFSLLSRDQMEDCMNALATRLQMEAHDRARRWIVDSYAALENATRHDDEDSDDFDPYWRADWMED